MVLATSAAMPKKLKWVVSPSKRALSARPSTTA